MNKKEEELLHIYFRNHCAKVQGILESHYPNGVGSRFMEAVMRHGNMDVNFQKHVILSTLSMSIRMLLNASCYDALYAIDTWSSTLEAAFMANDALAEKILNDEHSDDVA